MSDTRTFWLSFCDGNRPKGQQFLGVAIVDVTAADAAEVAEQLTDFFPQAQAGAEWIAAAARLAWRHGCNPGGQMASIDITGAPEAASCPHNRLLQKPELVALDAIEVPE